MVGDSQITLQLKYECAGTAICARPKEGDRHENPGVKLGGADRLTLDSPMSKVKLTSTHSCSPPMMSISLLPSGKSAFFLNENLVYLSVDCFSSFILLLLYIAQLGFCVVQLFLVRGLF